MIRCPYHGWTYGLDGELRVAPFFERPGTGDGQPIRLSALAVAQWGGFVFVCDSPGEDLAGQLGPVIERLRRYPLDELRRGSSLQYEVAANWKVIAENYNECYHCGPVHPELCTLVPAFRGGGTGLESTDGIPTARGVDVHDVGHLGTSAVRRTRRIRADAARGRIDLSNLLLSLSAEHVAAIRLVPRGANQTTVQCDLLFHPDELASPLFDPSDAGDLWDLVNRQDWAMCERVQRGCRRAAGMEVGSHRWKKTPPTSPGGTAG